MASFNADFLAGSIYKSCLPRVAYRDHFHFLLKGSGGWFHTAERGPPHRETPPSVVVWLTRVPSDKVGVPG